MHVQNCCFVCKTYCVLDVLVAVAFYVAKLPTQKHDYLNTKKNTKHTICIYVKSLSHSIFDISNFVVISS